MFIELVRWTTEFGRVITTAGIGFGILWYCFWTTQDYRLRYRFSKATAHLTAEDLHLGRQRNIDVLVAYYQSCATAKLLDTRVVKAERQVHFRRAKAALVMVTVLDEHIAASAKVAAPLSYLYARRQIILEAKRKRKMANLST
ncbi:hypothetical protein SAMN04488515_3454 [Cognatiyoonia koreensis]|uniref:Uncharacterized protein n=1 Tax=Cognatiyoonia koreensis TaxID=364200 RepID=A0A1I0RXJ8_9RHOB|nr:hypothetical protein [Cognatiyoonia koreensis]SEW46145.1 hypothetical protein SAMN04488515_3454 [Cognatiyoonia koreensis]